MNEYTSDVALTTRHLHARALANQGPAVLPVRGVASERLSLSNHGHRRGRSLYPSIWSARPYLLLRCPAGASCNPGRGCLNIDCKLCRSFFLGRLAVSDLPEKLLHVLQHRLFGLDDSFVHNRQDVLCTAVHVRTCPSQQRPEQSCLA